MVDLPDNYPICREEMEKGYVNSGIFWTKRKHKWRVPFDAESLVGSRFLPGFMDNVEAHRCRNCKIVLFSYDKEKDEKQNSSQVSQSMM